MIRKLNHIALSIEGNLRYAKENHIEVSEVFDNCYNNILDVAKFQIEHNIPIISFVLFSRQFKEIQDSVKIVDGYDKVFKRLLEDDLISKNQIKLSFMGKWYDLPGRLVERVKSLIDDTKDYDKFFLNFYLNYDGQEEILDSVKLLIRQVEHGKILGENITKADIKDNLYSSYFLPPDLIIRNGKEKTTGGLLLWDSMNSKFIFSRKYWPEFSVVELKKSVDNFEKS